MKCKLNYVSHKPSQGYLGKSRRVGLLATEVTTRGGVQSFMLRIADVINLLLNKNKITAGYCISLNDSTEALRSHVAISPELEVWGAGKSKAQLIVRLLKGLPKTDVLFVGHIGLAPIARILKVLGRVKAYYVILHGIEAWRRAPLEDRIGLRGAAGLIATTKFTAEECSRFNGISLKHFHVIPLCADERGIQVSTGFKLNGQFKLICVARQSASERLKGFEQILDALALLKSEFPEIHLNMIGQGDDQPRLKQIATDLGIDKQVTFWGALSNEDLAAAYEDCDVFVMPSKKEGFGIVFLEAMRLGKPCIGGNHGGTPDVIEHGQTGFLVEHGDAPTLASYIRSLKVDAVLRNAMGEKAKALVDQKFSYQRFCDSYETYATALK